MYLVLIMEWHQLNTSKRLYFETTQKKIVQKVCLETKL